MEAVASTHVYKNLQSYWRRRRYERVVDEKKDSDNKRMVRLGDGRERRKGSWRLRALKKVFVGVKVKIPTPKRLLLKLRDSYVGAMHSWAGTVPPPSTTDKKKKKKITDGKRKAARTRRIHSQKEGEMSEFDKKMILHIYSTVMSNPRELMRISA